MLSNPSVAARGTCAGMSQACGGRVAHLEHGRARQQHAPLDGMVPDPVRTQHNNFDQQPILSVFMHAQVTCT